MLADCPPQAVGQHEEQGSCGEIEDFVKSFIPSLFNSDSDSEDAFYPQPLSSTDRLLELPQLSRPLTIPDSVPELGGFLKTESLSEASSPSSQNNSSLSTFRPQLDSSGSIDDQSTFQSMLSIASSTTTTSVDPFFKEERPAKRAKATPPRGFQGPLPCAEETPCIKEEPPSSKIGAPVACSPSCQQRLPRPASLQCLAELPPPAASTSPATHVAMGHPLPQPRSSAPASNTLWRSSHSMQQSTSCSEFPSNPGPWPAPQSVIPTAPITALYQQQNAAQPAQPPAAGSAESIAAALDRVAGTTSGRPPLGLKLDKLGVLRQMNTLGMRPASS